MEFSLRVSGLEGRLLALGLPRYITRDFAGLVVRYSKNCGPAWTVSRLKSLKNDLVRIRAGLPPLTWVRKNRRGGWYGILGALRTYAAKSDECFKRAVNALMVYSRFVPDSPTDEHIRKFRTAVQAEDSYIPPAMLSDLAEHARHVVGSVDLGETTPLVLFEGHPSVKAPVMYQASVPQDSQLWKELRWLSYQRNAHFVSLHHSVYDGVFEGLTWLENTRMVDRPWRERNGKPPSWWRPSLAEAGKVVPLTKDGGWKVRWIASPYRIHQLALKPLGDALFKVLRQLPWDCTFDQTKAVPSIQEHLRQGGTAYAVDLTSATDYFPLQLQESVLRALFPEEHVNLFVNLARATWKSPIGDVSWTRGQPMGLYPSFASFALTHGLLLDLLSGGVPGRFFVLGDDVVILHQQTYERYREVLELLKCPHDPVKSIVSTELTEFAGKIILADKVIPQFKWRDISDDNFLEMMRAFGQRFEQCLTRRQREAYRAVARLLSPYGCNHSSGNSLPLEEVVALTDTFEDSVPERSARRLHTSFLRWITRLNPPDDPSSLFRLLNFQRLRRRAAALDERVQIAFSNTPFAGWASLPDALTDVLEVTGVDPGLPAQGPKNWAGRETLLAWYERAIRLYRAKR